MKRETAREPRRSCSALLSFRKISPSPPTSLKTLSNRRMNSSIRIGCTSYNPREKNAKSSTSIGRNRRKDQKRLERPTTTTTTTRGMGRKREDARRGKGREGEGGKGKGKRLTSRNHRHFLPLYSSPLWCCPCPPSIPLGIGIGSPHLPPPNCGGTGLAYVLPGIGEEVEYWIPSENERRWFVPTEAGGRSRS
jgi:hypothetical protein